MPGGSGTVRAGLGAAQSVRLAGAAACKGPARCRRAQCVQPGGRPAPPQTGTASQPPAGTHHGDPSAAPNPPRRALRTRTGAAVPPRLVASNRRAISSAPEWMARSRPSRSGVREAARSRPPQPTGCSPTCIMNSSYSRAGPAQAKARHRLIGPRGIGWSATVYQSHYADSRKNGNPLRSAMLRLTLRAGAATATDSVGFAECGLHLDRALRDARRRIQNRGISDCVHTWRTPTLGTL